MTKSSELLPDGPLELELRDVHFGYHGTGRPLLQGVSLVVPAGKSCAIVGTSGGGKSTILRLLYRSYDCSGGSVLVGGKDVKELQVDSLRRAIGVVPQVRHDRWIYYKYFTMNKMIKTLPSTCQQLTHQETVLFNESIHYNIHYGREGATEEEVREAAKKASLHDAILSFPKKYDTQVRLLQ